jgi:hypothetical protein
VVEGSTRLEPTAMLRAMTDVAADELRGVRLARVVAESADARLTDPRDAEVYRRFVEAVLRWRAFTYPVLPGTETAGRRRPMTTVASGLEQLLPTAKAGTALDDLEAGDTAAVEVEPVGAMLLGGHVRDVLTRLRQD